MKKGYDKGIDIYYRDITSHYHYKASPCIFPLDHDNLQKFMLHHDGNLDRVSFPFNNMARWVKANVHQLS